jgi:hypothetical protein
LYNLALIKKAYYFQENPYFGNLEEQKPPKRSFVFFAYTFSKPGTMMIVLGYAALADFAMSGPDRNIKIALVAESFFNEKVLNFNSALKLTLAVAFNRGIRDERRG